MSSTPNWKMNRRHFISGAGTVFLMPLFESLVPFSLFARAAQAAVVDPKRFVSVYFPNGTYNTAPASPWYPATGALSTSSGALPLVLAPFASNMTDLSILKGIKQTARDASDAAFYKATGGGGGHVSAITTWLTQALMTQPSATTCSMPGPSFDTLMAQKTGKNALLMSGGAAGDTESKFNGYGNTVSFDMNGQVLLPFTNPYNLFNQMFANLVPSASAAPATTAAGRNHSILDSSLADLADLKSRLGKSDKAKLDQYETNIRNLETKLFAAAPAVVGGCKKGTSPGTNLNNTDSSGTQNNYIARMQAFFDMTVLAFQCDLTRTVSILMDGETGTRHINAQTPAGLLYQGASMTGDIHTGVSHYGSADTSVNVNEGINRCITRDRVFMYLVMDLINKLKAATDASGSPILDNTVLFGGFGVMDGNHNWPGNVAPVFTAGGRNFMRPGYAYDMSGSDMKDVLFTLSQKLGMGLASFQGSTKTLVI